MALSISVEKKRFLFRAFATTSAKPGSYMGSLSKSGSFQAAMRSSLMSTTLTVILGHCLAITAMVGPPT